MSRIKLVFDVVNDMRTLADSLSELAGALANDYSEVSAAEIIPKQEIKAEKPVKAKKPKVATKTSTYEETLQTEPTQAEIPQTEPIEKPIVTFEMARSLAAKLAKAGMREEVKTLIGQYGVKNITAIDEHDLETFYSELAAMEVTYNAPN